MRSTTRVFATLLLCLPAAAAAQTPTRADTSARAVDWLLDPWRDTESPGCVIAVARRGRTLYQRGYGMADIESGVPMRPGTVVHAASLAKQFTAMSVLLLVREGKVSLDDDVRRIIPELPDYGATITVRHLLTHTSFRDDVTAIVPGRAEGYTRSGTEFRSSTPNYDVVGSDQPAHDGR